MKVKSPLEVYKFLPQTNCGECGYDTCMSFAAHIIDRAVKPTDCPPLVKESEKDPKLKKKLEELIKLTSPESGGNHRSWRQRHQDWRGRRSPQARTHVLQPHRILLRCLGYHG